VHRDIKPGNLLITADGTTKITDFGIAKARAEQEANLTATGIVMGTALYVSPEQATGQEVTGASDIYSLGVVAYECLAGQPPFIAEQPLAIAIMHKHDPVPPLPADVPRPVSDLVFAMLAKEPGGRPPTARHVADRADMILDARAVNGQPGPGTADLPVVPGYPPAPETVLDFPERARGASPPAGRRLVAVGAGAALCGVAAIAGVLLLSSPHGNGIATTGSGNSPSHSASSTPTKSARPTSPGDPTTGNNVVNVPTTSPATSKAASKSPTAKAHTTPTPTATTPTPTATTPTPTPTTTTPTPTPTTTTPTPTLSV
jgi:eukaryotic-like serine/threonine-protein kinase